MQFDINKLKSADDVKLAAFDRRLYDKIHVLEEQISQAKKLRKEVAAEVERRMNNQGNDVFRVRNEEVNVTASKVPKDAVSVSDGAAFVQWMQKHNDFTLLKVGALKNEVKAYARASGVLPPGVSYRSWTEVQLKHQAPKATS